MNHFERPETLVERDLVPNPLPSSFERGFWRYSVGSAQRLPWGIRLNEEISLFDAPHDDGNLRWRVRASRMGLFGLKSARTSVTLYNLYGQSRDGYGGRISVSAPIMDHSLYLRSSLGYRMADAGGQSKNFDVTDVSLDASYQLGGSWSLDTGVRWALGDDLDSISVNLQIAYRW